MFVFLSSFSLSYISILFLIPILKNNFLDHPNYRSSHIVPKPRGGGVVFIVIGSLAALFNQNWPILICSLAGLIGFIDDRYDIPGLLKYLSHLFLHLNMN